MSRDGDGAALPSTAVSDTAQLNKPLDTALRQQRLRAWQPILHPLYAVATFLILGAALVPSGIYIQNRARDIVELSIQYDSSDKASNICDITKANENRTCLLNFTVPKDMDPPILVHYQLDNFYQNYLGYTRSRDDWQLLGNDATPPAADYCKPLRKLGDVTLNPCGLIANTLFNDVFSLVSGVDSENNPLVMREKGIAWASDIKYKFKQPDGFRYEECSSCDSCSCGGDWSCKEPYQNDQGTCFRYFYPKENTTQYLYETYPMVVSPIEGVLNEHFIVWMRTAALPKFRKLYGYIEKPIPAGQTLVFQVNANYEIKKFKGAKTIILSTNSDFGGKNLYLGKIFYIVGIVFLVLGLFFGFKQIFKPRVLADSSYLSVKED